MTCIDDTTDPCYWRGTDHTCTRTQGDGPCVHAERIAKRRQDAKEAAR